MIRKWITKKVLCVILSQPETHRNNMAAYSAHRLLDEQVEPSTSVWNRRVKSNRLTETSLTNYSVNEPRWSNGHRSHLLRGRLGFDPQEGSGAVSQ